ncbi:hypothetical protein SynRS9915_00170 [Synechococcus sp. RS9915]|nr:hypothetical protein SynRS9915_00170 [Synechococcus sp. RS9915]
MAITTKQQRQQRRKEALQLIADGVPPTDAASQLTVKWGCSRSTSLRDLEIAQSELANALDSVELQQMVGWLATQYQRLAAKAEKDGQLSAAVGALNALPAMVVQPQLDAQFAAHFRSRLTHHGPEGEMPICVAYSR